MFEHLSEMKYYQGARMAFYAVMNDLQEMRRESARERKDWDIYLRAMVAYGAKGPEEAKTLLAFWPKFRFRNHKRNKAGRLVEVEAYIDTTN